MDITSRNARRNMNNPNNPNYNPRLKKGQKRDDGLPGEGFASVGGMGSGPKSLYDDLDSSMQMQSHTQSQSTPHIPPPGLTHPGSLQDEYSPFLSQDPTVGGTLRMSAFEQPLQPLQPQPQSQSRSPSLFQAGPVPVYSGTLNLSGNSVGRMSTPTSQREVITNVITSLALDDPADSDDR